MQFVDIIFCLIILLFAILATKNGFIREVFGKLAIVLGIIVGISFTGLLEPNVSKIISNKVVATVVCFLLLFIVTFLLVHIIQTLISRAFDGEILQGLDRVLGFFLGVVEGCVVVCLILILLISQPWFNELTEFARTGFFYSVFGPVLESPIEYMTGVFASNVRQSVISENL